jgi:hypothetical protein
MKNSALLCSLTGKKNVNEDISLPEFAIEITEREIFFNQ